MSVFGMTFHRYMVLLYRFEFSKTLVWAFIAFLWLTPFSLCILILHYGVETVLQTSKLYCLVDFTSTTPINIASSVLIFLFIAVTMLFLIFAYSRITFTYLRAQDKKKNRNANGELRRRVTVMSEKEVRLIKKAFAINLAFIFCWVSFLGKLVYEASTHQPVNYGFDAFLDFLGCLNPCLNFFILYYFDAKCRMNINELFDYEFLHRSFHLLLLQRRDLIELSPYKRKRDLEVANVGGEGGGEVGGEGDHISQTKLLAIRPGISGGSQDALDTIKL